MEEQGKEKKMRTGGGAPLELIERASLFRSRIAIVSDKHEFRYSDLLYYSSALAQQLLLEYGKFRAQQAMSSNEESKDSEGKAATACTDLEEARVAYVVHGSFDYVAVQWAIWMAGGIAVPMHTTYPAPELEYIVKDADAAIVLAHPNFAERLEPVARKCASRFIVFGGRLQPLVEPKASEPSVAPPLLDLTNRRALILYTSGTTGKPKGVVSTHAVIAAQVHSLVTAWEWRDSDSILHVLPLHHIHGVVNVLTCALWSGAKVHFMPKFDAIEVWERFVALSDLTLFMAVPTIYSKLINAFRQCTPEAQQRYRSGCKHFRLMVSGSAALPDSMHRQWEELSGVRLLERYGMTEIGMALSNPLHGERRAGFVGKPLPGVECSIAFTPENKESGELRVKGPNVFAEYWQRPDATRVAFDDKGFFMTGDVVSVDDKGDYRILGRASVDVLKSGGYKISALEIERELLERADVAEVAVIGLPDDEWGQLIAAMIRLTPDALAKLVNEKKDPVPECNGFRYTALASELRTWLKARFAPQKVPKAYIFVDAIPRNAMGKVNKVVLIKQFPTAASAAPAAGVIPTSS